MRILKYAAGILAALILIVAGAGYFYFRSTMPEIDGEIRAQGLTNQVEIIRDEWGVPHIFADNKPDLYYALGYAMAQDRLFQMDFMRRVARGRLSEILGPDLVPTDHFLRTIYALWPEERADRELTGEYRKAAEAYTAGVNEYIQNHSGALPLEFTILGYEPEPWRITDGVYMFLLLGWDLNTGFKGDLIMMKLVDKLGPEMAEQAMPVYPGRGPTIMSRWSGEAADAVRAVAGLKDVLQPPSIFSSEPGGSNGWAVSGKKTDTGRAVLCADPHLGLTTPSIWYEVHLKAEDLNVSGVTIPGMPGVVIGNNLHVAWGSTNTMLDDTDFFIEKLNQSNPNQYEYQGQWEDIRIIETRIRVKDADPVIKKIRVTRHGPIINDIRSEQLKHVLAMRWSLNDGSGAIEGLMKLNAAENWEEARAGIDRIFGPAQNIPFADKDGNIGFMTVGRIPIRAHPDDGALPMPGWTGEYDWQGYVPPAENPQAFNPESGFVVLANNKTAPDEYPHYISRYFASDYRARRIKELLEGKEKLSLDDQRRIQNDLRSAEAADFAPVIAEALKKGGAGDSDLAGAADRLSKWDHTTGVDSVASTLFYTIQVRLFDNILKDELGDALFNEYRKVGYHMVKAFQAIMADPDSKWWDNVLTEDRVETREEVIVQSAREAIAELREKFGEDMNEWRWGRIHQHRSGHLVFKDVKPLARFFNIGPFPLGGSKSTVAPAAYKFDEPFQSSHGPSFRQIIDFDFSDPENNIRVITTGCSGRPGSPFYDNQSKLWRKGEYHPVLMDRQGVDRHAEATLVLKPGS